MLKSLFSMGLVLSYFTCYSQVGISTNSNFTPEPQSSLHVDGINKTVILPKADNIMAFPLYNASAPDLFDDDPTLTGAILFNKEDENIWQYDGTKWKISDPIVQTLKTPQLAHFTRNGNVRIGNCSPCTTVTIPFVSNGSFDFNNISSDVVLNENLFRIGTTGVYRISFKSPVLIRRSLIEQTILFTGDVFVELQVSKNNGSTWTVYSSNSYSEVGGIIGGATINNSIRANLSLSTALNLEANDLIRFRAGGERTVYGVPFLDPSYDYMDLDTPVNGAIGEVIFEKVNF
jgi:hypothetical protein